MEKEPFYFDNLFKGNWDLFREAFTNRWTSIVYDIDGILIDSPKVVLRDFTMKTGVPTNPVEIDQWNYLSRLAERLNLPEDWVNSAEQGWYDPVIIDTAKRYLHIGPVVDQTIRLFGAERNFVLTSREPEFADTTFTSIRREFPKIYLGNILIRDKKSEKPTEFKVKELRKIAKHAPYVVFIEDSTKYVKAVLDAKIENCLVINIPLGIVKPDFEDLNLIVMGRFPTRLQAMYTLYAAINKVTS